MNLKCAPFALPLLFTLFSSQVAQAEAPYTRLQLEALAQESSRSIQAVRNQVDAAKASVDTASAFPNPELEYQKGDSRAKLPGAVAGNVKTYTLTQPIDLPGRRGARIAAAEAGLQSATALGRGLEADIIARLRLRYFEVLRRQAELKAALEDQAQMEGVRDRIGLRVETGEAPRFELVKADAEMLNSQKNAFTAELRVRQSRAALRALVGPSLPEDFVLAGKLDDVAELTEIASLRKQIRETNPDLLRARAEQTRATKQLEYERAQRWPTLALRATREEEPELQTSRVGFVISIPIWDRRSGPVGEATANLARANNELAHNEFALDRGIEVAYEQYQIAQAQVAALESGIVRQAENAVRIAENAYRFGERGILEVIDAQRVYRAARSELISARYEVAASWTEIERLRATLPTQP